MTEAEAEVYVQTWHRSQAQVRALIYAIPGAVLVAVVLSGSLNPAVALVSLLIATLAWVLVRTFLPPPTAESLNAYVLHGELWDSRNVFGESMPGVWYLGGRRAYRPDAWEVRMLELDGRRVRATVICFPPQEELFLLEVEPIRGDGALSVEADVASGRIVPGEGTWARWRREWNAAPDGPRRPRHRGDRSRHRR